MSKMNKMTRFIIFLFIMLSRASANTVGFEGYYSPTSISRKIRCLSGTTLNWFKNSTPINLTIDGNKYNLFESDLQINNLSIADEGEYACYDTENPTTVYIYPEKVSKADTQYVITNLGKSLEIRSNYKFGNESKRTVNNITELCYRAHLHETDVNELTNDEMYYSDDELVFKIQDPTASAYHVQVKVVNAQKCFGNTVMDENRFFLNRTTYHVFYLPELNISSSSNTIKEGGDVSFTCEVTTPSIDNVSVCWTGPRYDSCTDHLLPSNCSNAKDGKMTCTLTISNASAEHSGDYTCRAIPHFNNINATEAGANSTHQVTVIESFDESGATLIQDNCSTLIIKNVSSLEDGQVQFKFNGSKPSSFEKQPHSLDIPEKAINITLSYLRDGVEGHGRTYDLIPCNQFTLDKVIEVQLESECNSASLEEEYLKQFCHENACPRISITCSDEATKLATVTFSAALENIATNFCSIFRCNITSSSPSPTPTPSSSPTTSTPDMGMSIYVIIIAVLVLVIVLVVFCCALVVCCRFRKQQKNGSDNSELELAQREPTPPTAPTAPSSQPPPSQSQLAQPLQLQPQLLSSPQPQPVASQGLPSSYDPSLVSGFSTMSNLSQQMPPEQPTSLIITPSMDHDGKVSIQLSWTSDLGRSEAGSLSSSRYSDRTHSSGYDSSRSGQGVLHVSQKTPGLSLAHHHRPEVIIEEPTQQNPALPQRQHLRHLVATDNEQIKYRQKLSSTV